MFINVVDCRLIHTNAHIFAPAPGHGTHHHIQYVSATIYIHIRNASKCCSSALPFLLLLLRYLSVFRLFLIQFVSGQREGNLIFVYFLFVNFASVHMHKYRQRHTCENYKWFFASVSVCLAWFWQIRFVVVSKFTCKLLFLTQIIPFGCFFELFIHFNNRRSYALDVLIAARNERTQLPTTTTTTTTTESERKKKQNLFVNIQWYLCN